MRDFRTQAQVPDAEQLIEFTELYDSHRVGLYKGWTIVQPFDEADCDILCFLPNEELESDVLYNIDMLKDYYTPEWHASSMNEAIEFIDSYDIFE